MTRDQTERRTRAAFGPNSHTQVTESDKPSGAERGPDLPGDYTIRRPSPADLLPDTTSCRRHYLIKPNPQDLSRRNDEPCEQSV